MAPPLPDGRGIERTTNLYRAGGGRRRLALVETENAVFPWQIDEFDEATALCCLIAHYVFVAHFQQRMRRQRFLPVLGKTTKCQIIFSQFELII